ncbi:hypothetical protein DFR29_106167 [Tahibacter aquaticus]|uniref:Uncharacterized protein n=1 Tax=Tahibacter aquaticus TaxID=520092 RepID=A0A4R6YYD9_9GAMM|nr:hypothetical protein DFR29_106167 [Tahibacter aquaticus]
MGRVDDPSVRARGARRWSHFNHPAVVSVVERLTARECAPVGKCLEAFLVDGGGRFAHALDTFYDLLNARELASFLLAAPFPEDARHLLSRNHNVGQKARVASVRVAE